MVALHTQKDRKVFALQQQIRQIEIWLDVDKHDRRAVGFHRAKLAELRNELDRLLEGSES